VLLALLDAARESGHALRLLYPASRNADGTETPTFIHSKILIIDDHLLMVGSPNFTERSVALDTELAISWSALAKKIAWAAASAIFAASSLRSTAGLPRANFAVEHGLCAKLDRLLASGETRLRQREVGEAGLLGPIFAQISTRGIRR